MKTYLIVDNGVVINSVMWDGISEWAPDVGIAVESDGVAGIGWFYDDGVFIDPNQQNQPDHEAELNQKMDLLSSAFRNDVQNLNLAYLSALVVDGASEDGKVAKIRLELSERKQKYKDDVDELVSQYGG